MSQSRTTAKKSRLSVKIYIWWIAFFGLVCSLGSINGESANSSSAEQNSSVEAAETKSEVADEKHANSHASSDKKSASNRIVKPKKKKKSEPATKDEEQSIKERGSVLLPGDQSTNVVRITGDGIKDFFRRIEYLRPRQ